jgi:hypothetical protein
LRLSFGLVRDGSPLIYSFLGDYLLTVPKKLGYKAAKLAMECLEPIDWICSNIGLPTEKSEGYSASFAKCMG